MMDVTDEAVKKAAELLNQAVASGQYRVAWAWARHHNGREGEILIVSKLKVITEVVTKREWEKLK